VSGTTCQQPSTKHNKHDGVAGGGFTGGVSPPRQETNMNKFEEALDLGRAEAMLISLYALRTSRCIVAPPSLNVKSEQLDLLLLPFPQRGEQA
jgi:hypothetical protein